jgi:hypothetical protein
MTIEIPVLRLGTAGYSEAQQGAVAEAAKAASGPRAQWEVGAFADADAWWLEGRRTLLLPNQCLRVQPAVPTGRSVQIALADVDRPVGFTLPLTAPGFKPAVAFALEDRHACVHVLHQFTAWMQVPLAQFALGSSIADNQPTLGAGTWEVIHEGDLLAVVDLKLGAAVDPAATPSDFEQAIWCLRDLGAVMVPSTFRRVSVSQLMWLYAQRTRRDLLPPHYRLKPLFFRRPPRLAQRQLKDAHLLVMRELVAQPGLTFHGLQQVTGLGEDALARYLSALYVVGSVTSNPRRAAGGVPAHVRDSMSPDPSLFESVLDSAPRPPDLELRPQADFTAPLPLHE